MEKEATEDLRDAQAKALGAIHVIEVEGKRLYLKMPPRHILGIGFSQMERNKTQAIETIAKGAAIRDVSDMELLENDTLFLSIMSDIADFTATIELKKSTSRKL